MDIAVPLPLAVIAALITLVIGYIVALINTDDRHRRLANQREQQIRKEYSLYKGEVREHFGQSSKLFSQVTEQYRQLYLHMSQGARLFADAPPTPMLKKLEKEHRNSSRQRRIKAEPSLTEPALDNALVELRDDLHQFNSTLAPQSVPAKAGTGGVTWKNLGDKDQTVK